MFSGQSWNQVHNTLQCLTTLCRPPKNHTIRNFLSTLFSIILLLYFIFYSYNCYERCYFYSEWSDFKYNMCLLQFLTSLTVGFSLLHVKGLVPDGSLAGCTLETLNMVGHLQGMHDFLIRGEKIVNVLFSVACTAEKTTFMFFV